VSTWRSTDDLLPDTIRSIAQIALADARALAGIARDQGQVEFTTCTTVLPALPGRAGTTGEPSRNLITWRVVPHPQQAVCRWQVQKLRTIGKTRSPVTGGTS